MDYAMPKAEFFPPFELDRTVTTSPLNPLGAKGIGEAATIGSTPAVANAVVDALLPAGHHPHRHPGHGAEGVERDYAGQDGRITPTTIKRRTPTGPALMPALFHVKQSRSPFGEVVVLWNVDSQHLQ